MPEPIPLSAIPQPPQPVNPPQLSDLSLTLGGDRVSAFGAEDSYNNGKVEEFGEGCAWFVTAGSNALMRQRLDHSPIAVFHPRTIVTGNAPPPNAPVVLDSHDIDPVYAWGVRAGIGYRWGCREAIELSGFYIPEQSASDEVDIPGRLDLPFRRSPQGFGVSRRLGLQADRVRIVSDTNLSNGELNYRYAPEEGYGLELLAGVRYFDLHDRFSIITDGSLTASPPDPSRTATYSIHTHNRLVGGQLGIDWERAPFRWLAFGWFAKGTWGENFLDADVTLQRGDRLRGSGGHRSHTQFSHLYETGLFLDLYITDRIRLRTGYNALWVLNVAEALDQLDFDLSHRAGRPKDDGNIFYHGPLVEFHVLF